MEQNVKTLAFMVKSIRARLDSLGIQYKSIGQCMGKDIFIFAEKERWEEIWSVLLAPERKVTQFMRT